MNFLEKSFIGRNQWYWYVFSLLIIFTATQIGSLPLIGYLIWENPDMLTTGIKPEAITAVTSTNLGLALMLFSFVVGFFTIFLCLKFFHHKKVTDIITGRNQIDWSRIFFGAFIWAILSIIAFCIPFIFGDTSSLVFQFEPSQFFIMLIISLLMFPFQTSFEELIFRGYLMQWSTILFKYRWISVLITGVLFGIMHIANPEVDAFGICIALPQYILMGLLLGYVAVKDNGMELSLGIHAANNILAAITFTSESSTLQTHALFVDTNPTSSWTDILVIAFSGIIFLLICNRKYHFMKKVNLLEKINQ